jgi:hypothetical protein
MPNNVANMLNAARRSMEEMILPALEGANPLAREQAQLVIQALAFVESQLPYLHAKDRAEMIAYAAIARDVLAIDLDGADPIAVTALRQALDLAGRLENEVNTPSRDLQQAGEALAGALGALVRSLGKLSDESRSSVRKAVVLGTARVLDIHRAFFLPTGFDKAASALPPLASLLHGENRAPVRA